MEYYEKKYKEAIERARKLNNGECIDVESGTTISEYIFPELKESEDERIRKALIYHYQGDGCLCTNEYRIDYKDIRTWLEKQGQVKETINSLVGEDEKIRKGIISGMKALQEKGKYTCFANIPMDNVFAWLEKQGEQLVEIDRDDIETIEIWEDIIKEKRIEWKLSDWFVDATSLLVQKLKGTNKNCIKPADKVEPKFKVGDWVMLDRPVLITKVEYMPYNTHQYWTSDGTWFGDATEAKLWTIKDAKAGDVLVVERDKSPFIFKGFDKFHPECPVAYCGIDDNGIFINNSGDGWWTDENVEPATEEQRNLLFKKMKEAGYEWDAEKKEMKKIEQNTKSNDDIKYDIIEFIRSRGGFKQEYLNYIANTCNKNKLIKDICKWLKNYAKLYVNGEYNQHHQYYEYDGTVNTDEMIKALKNRFEK